MDAFAALADPTRREIVESLARGERSAGAIADDFPISAPAVSQHLKVLRETGLVRVRAQAQRRLYQLNHERLTEIHDWLERVRAYWPARLDALEQRLHEED